MGFDELQEMAKAARTVPVDTKSEVTEWMQLLEQVDRGAKGSTVPWDLSDDDIETLEGVPLRPSNAQASSRRSRRRSSAATPMIRMDTEEMSDKEQRLDSGEVVRKPAFRSDISNWSESNLPTPPKSSPVPQSSTVQAHRILSSITSTNSADRRRKRSTEDAGESAGGSTPKRSRLSPLSRRTKGSAGIRATTRQTKDSQAALDVYKAGSAPGATSSARSTKQLNQSPTLQSFLVPKLLTGAAEALRTKNEPRILRDIEQTSPDRQTTADELSTQGAMSTQQSLISEWQLSSALIASPPKFCVPDLHRSHVVLSPDVSGMPYLTQDLLGGEGVKWSYAHEWFESSKKHDLVQPGINNDAEDIIVLMEPRRHDPSLKMLKYLVGRVPNDRSQIIWAFNWRLVEDTYARGVEDDERLMEKRLIGRFRYAPNGELRWLSAPGEFHVIPKENIEDSRGMSGYFLRPEMPGPLIVNRSGHDIVSFGGGNVCTKDGRSWSSSSPSERSRNGATRAKKQNTER